MSGEKPEIARSGPNRRKIKREILIISILAAALIAAGAIYTALYGPVERPNFQAPVQVHDEGPASIVRSADGPPEPGSASRSPASATEPSPAAPSQ